MLSKRSDTLLKQLEKYKKEEHLNKDLIKYFESMTAYRLPTINNVLTILRHNFKYSIKLTYKHDRESGELATSIISEIFNAKRFRADLKYDSIRINGNIIRYTHQDIYKEQKYNRIYLI